jgi:hypothetical protein
MAVFIILALKPPKHEEKPAVTAYTAVVFL